MQMQTKADWLGRFGRRLMRLNPTMTAVVAAKHSFAAWRDSPGAEPERAAEAHAVGMPHPSGRDPDGREGGLVDHSE